MRPERWSGPDYSWLLEDPDELGVPSGFDLPALPGLVEPAAMPPTSSSAPGDGELLVRVEHPHIQVLDAYWRVGLEGARPGALLRRAVVDRLEAVCRSLPQGFGLAVLDAWRSLDLQAVLHHNAYADPDLAPGFVEVPSLDPRTPPPHLTGGAVDVTLTWQNRALRLGSGFDEFCDRARTAAFEPVPGRVRDLRRLLYWAMREKGFVVADCEWWHFEYGTRRWAALCGTTPRYGAADAAPGSQ